MAVIKIVPMPGAKGDKGDDGAAGAQGPQGPIGATGPAGADAAWYYNGAYNPGASYVVGDVVTYDGQTWYRKNANGGNVGDTPSEGLFWDLIAAKGVDGEPGTPGTELNFWNFVGDPGLPTVDGALVVDGISGRSGGNAVVFGGPGGSVILAANNGEFLKDCNVSSNQIATVGNIEEIDTLSNGLVVTGQIDDPIINPAGTMSLSVQDGYTALMDVVAQSAVFNGDVQITNLNGTRNTTIDTPTTINNEVNIQTEYGEGWTFNNDGYILGPWLSSAEDPANTGRYIRLNGITRADNNPLLISSSGPVLINGTGGEFLNSHGDPNNQIATIGDIENAISQSGSLTYKSGAVPATHHGVAGDTKNDIKYDDTHMYICVADYTDGSAVIWKRINWASGNW